jgi:uncharacterized pyridoxamine 5'-phosphate oxidase family protein
MNETPEDLRRLQHTLDRSMEAAGPHLRGIITDERRLSADRLAQVLQGMRLLVVSTVTADGRPLVGPVDGYFIRGSMYFSSGRNSVRMRHLAKRPFVSACHVLAESLAVTVHGTAELFDVADPDRSEFRRAVLDHYLPLQGPAFEDWLDSSDALGARIEAEKLFVFHLPG